MTQELPQDAPPEAPQEAPPEVPQGPPPCRHEHVRIYQRKLKGLERRLVATKAWLPVGFKQADFSHLGEGSYCFCTKCRARLYPKRSNAEKAQARLALAASKLQAAAEAESDSRLVETDILAAEMADEKERTDESVAAAGVRVEELEIEAVELEDLEEGAVAVESEDSCNLSGDEG
ncbi:MAG TPA: hypothetical protein V6D22_08615 [Candidatus Obscuribacterales bacterium]